jgi:hypothetical protein
MINFDDFDFLTLVENAKINLKKTGFLSEKRVLEEDVRGEYWITDYGIQYADGDVGDMNHEMIAAQQVTGELLSYFDVELGEEVPTNFNYLEREQLGEISDFLFNEMGRDDEEEWEEQFEDNYINYIEDYLKKQDIENLGDKLKVVWDQMDARVYGLKNLGWKRIHGNWIETWTLSQGDLKEIVSGIYEIMEQEGFQDIEDENEEFNIEVRANGRTFTDIPWSILQKENLMKLVEYRDKPYRESVEMFTERDTEPEISQKEQEYANRLEDDESSSPESEEDLNPMGDGEEGSEEFLDDEVGGTDDKIGMVLDTETGINLVQMAVDFISKFDNEGTSKFNLTRIDPSINEENAIKTYREMVEILGDFSYLNDMERIRSDLSDATGIQLFQKIVSVVKRARFGDIIFDEFRSNVDKKIEKGNVRETYQELMQLFDDVSIPI